MRLICAFALLACLPLGLSASVRVLTTEMEVNVAVEKAWSAWTTADGVKTFFAPGCLLEPRVDGAYDIYFAPDAKPGARGAEGMRVLGLEPMRRFAFTWNAPPHIPDVRSQRTMVIVEFMPITSSRTRVRFTEIGWGEGKSWDQAYDYFDHAWNEIVLPRFKHAMEVGPIDWNKVPSLKPIAKTLKVRLESAPATTVSDNAVEDHK